MVFRTTTSAVVPAVAAGVFACALAACVAAPGVAADRAATLRVMVKLTRPSADNDAIAAEATRIAGVPVSHAAATSTTWHALWLHCAGDACDAALARLRAAETAYQAVEIDGRKAPAS